MDPQNPATINDIFFLVVTRDHPSPLLLRHGEQWLPLSARELYGRVVAVARALEARA